MTKHPDTCMFRNVARFSAVMTGMVSPCFVGLPDDIRALCTALERVVSGAAVLWRLHALVHAVIADHAGDAQPVVFENPRAALALGLAMAGHIAPGLDGGFVAKERQRQDLALLGQALEPLDRDKAIDGFQHRPELGRKVEIFLLVLRLRPDLENHCNHVDLLAFDSLKASPVAETSAPRQG